ncbi:hypothetical protein GCM10009593_22210 [Microlunatus antarcticus]|uniref:Alpha-glucuronidase n=1 Tax=Microlunatus antarcticus TaxID=53388 RepID=A0A7W5P756_9ACTN|nr:alpha-glucuronidase [Microlunatus antarcticus]
MTYGTLFVLIAGATLLYKALGVVGGVVTWGTDVAQKVTAIIDWFEERRSKSDDDDHTGPRT